MHIPPHLTGLPGRIVIDPDVDDLVDDLATDLVLHAGRCAARRGAFHLALSGGSTPVRLFRRLVTDPRFRALPWHDTHVWMVDDRCVPAHHDKSNWRLLRENLLDHVTTPAEQQHAMPVLQPDGDHAYERDLRDALTIRDARGIPRLDHVLLGMGDDGHTASLFPQTGALVETRRLVVFNDGERVVAPRPRMTMTYPLINAARRIDILIAGVSKADALRRVAACEGATPELPITAICPGHPDADLTWYLDAAAAG